MIDLIADPGEIILQEEPRRYIYRGKQFRSLTDRIRQAGFGDDFSAVPPFILKRAQDRGIAVHAACHYYDERDLNMDSVDPAIRGYVEAYIRFDTECPGKIVAVEKRLVAPEIGLACTPDLIRFVRGRRAAIERKTSQHIGNGAQLQTAGQVKAWNTLFPTQPIHDRFGLRLQSNGYYKLLPHDDLDDEAAFDDILAAGIACDRLERWWQKYGCEDLALRRAGVLDRSLA